MHFFRNSNDEVYLLIDIGSGSLTLSFVLYNQIDIPFFLHTVKKDFFVIDKPESAKLFENMLKILDEGLEEIVNEGKSHKYWKSSSRGPSGIIISFSSPWFMPKTKHIEMVREKPFTVSQKLIDDLIKKEELVFKDEISNSTNSEDQLEVVEKSIVHIKINGYVLREYIGQKTTKLDAFLCMSVVSLSVMTKIYDIIFKHTHVPKESVLAHTFPVISFSVLRDLYPNYSNFLLIDITSEITDLSLIENDIISQTASFPSGKNFIIRQISKNFKVPIEIAKSNLSLFVSRKLDVETAGKMEIVLNNVEKEWSIYLERAIQEISDGKILPSRVYMTTDSEAESIYTAFLKLSKADTTASFRKNADIVYVENKLFTQLFKNESITTPNEFIVMLAIFYNKILKLK